LKWRLSVSVQEHVVEPWKKASIRLSNSVQNQSEGDFEVALELSRNQKVRSMTTDPAARDVHLQKGLALMEKRPAKEYWSTSLCAP